LRILFQARTVFFASGFFLLALAVFALGMAAKRNDWAVWEQVALARDLVRSVLETGTILPNKSYYERTDSAPDQRYIVKNAAAMADGQFVITRLDAKTGRFVVELLAADGSVTHSWPSDYGAIVESGSNQTILHGVKAMPDGSLLVAYDAGTALARLDACGTPVWSKTDQVYHHVIQPDAEGFWTWQAGADANGDDQRMYRFDAETGAELESIDLIDDVVGASARNALIASIPEGYVFTRDTWDWSMEDIFHPNDVQPLPASMAAAFPQFRAGDLLISLRNIDLVAVVDRDNRDILWAMRGPWRAQHDPDWQPDGTITVYNNNPGRERSNIIRVDPKTNETLVLFDGDGPVYYSDVMGQHQLLPNGNWMILSPTEGRVMEVSANGELVREYTNIINRRFSAIVPNVEFVPSGFFTDLPNCDR